MIRSRSLLSLLVVLGASPALAQGRIIDEGAFTVTKAGAPARTESFKISRGETGTITATGHLTGGADQVTSSLTTDTAGTPVSYELAVRDGRTLTLGVKATARAGRLATATSNQRGDESMREYPLSSGSTVILEAGLFHQLYFVSLGHRSGSVQAIEPRASREGTIAVVANGLEPIDVGGRSVTATHYSITDRGVRTEFWVDPLGRLLRASIPSQGLTASREELPK